MLRSSVARGREVTSAFTCAGFVAVFVLSALWWTFDLGVLRAGAPHPSDDHWEDQLVARHLAAGEGFRTEMAYPPLWGLRDRRTLTMPVLVHGPLLPMATAPFMALLGPRRLDSVAPAAALVALLALIPVFRLGARHFGEPVGLAAAALFTFSPLTLEAVHHAGSVVVGAALLAWVFDLLARERPRAGRAGVIAGLAYLVRPETLVAMPLLAILAWRRGDARWPADARRRGAGPVTALFTGFVVAALPWWIHHARLVGSPFFNLTSYTLIGFWGARPDVSVMQDFSLTPARWPAVLHAELPHVTAKWLVFFPHAVKNALFTPSGATGWLVPIGAVTALAGIAAPRLPHRFTRRWVLCAIALALIPVVSQTLTSHQRLYVAPFLAIYVTFAAAGMAALVHLLPAWARRPRAWGGLLALLMAPSTLPALVAARDESRVLERRVTVERAALAREFGANPPRLLFSDTPDFVAWNTGRPTLWVSPAEFERLYPRSGAGEAERDSLPPRDQVAGWFHADFRDPADTGHVLRP